MFRKNLPLYGLPRQREPQRATSTKPLVTDRQPRILLTVNKNGRNVGPSPSASITRSGKPSRFIVARLNRGVPNTYEECPGQSG